MKCKILLLKKINLNQDYLINHKLKFNKEIPNRAYLS